MKKQRESAPEFFESQAAFRRWLAKHHGKATELWVGYWKIDSGKASMTWPESVDEALCFGWIDGVRKRIDEHAYEIRFSPRKATSIWSAVNIRRVEQLTQEGSMRPAGLRAFAARTEAKSRIYAFEQGDLELAPAYAKQLASKPRAAKFFAELPAGYRKKVIWWVMSAKQEETRRKRLATLISDCALGRRTR